MAANPNAAPIVLKRKRKGHEGHGGHGSGTWKVAYADFVTAMMAFFLLLWLLAVTTDEQRLGIANYFMPTTFTKGPTGSVGFSGGADTTVDGPLNTAPMSLPGVMMGMPPEDGDGSAYTEEELDGLSDVERERLLAEAEQEELERVRDELREALARSPDLEDLVHNLVIDRIPEGIRIQILDQDQRSMFPLGSAAMKGEMRPLMRQIVEVIGGTARPLSISGHTDNTPFRPGSTGDNWQLSSDRANAARRALVDSGLPEARIARVAGMADTEPIDPEDPTAAMNRRISIVLLREVPNGGL
jgi:chemotaxis protein MotB